MFILCFNFSFPNMNMDLDEFTELSLNETTNLGIPRKFWILASLLAPAPPSTYRQICKQQNRRAAALLGAKVISQITSGFNPSERFSSNWNMSPGRGENKKYLKPPTRFVDGIYQPWTASNSHSESQGITSYLVSRFVTASLSFQICSRKWKYIWSWWIVAYFFWKVGGSLYLVHVEFAWEIGNISLHFYPFSHNHSSVENHPKWKETNSLHFHDDGRKGRIPGWIAFFLVWSLQTSNSHIGGGIKKGEPSTTGAHREDAQHGVAKHLDRAGRVEMGSFNV